MAIGTIALAGTQGMHASNRPQFTYRVTFTCDADYRTGGYTSFSTALAAGVAALAGKTVISIQQANAASGYKGWWNRATDAWQVYQGAAGLGADSELPDHSNIATVLFEVIIEAI